MENRHCGFSVFRPRYHPKDRRAVLRGHRSHFVHAAQPAGQHLAGQNREIATIIGGIWGMLFLLFERYVFSIPVEVLRYAVLSLLLIPIIKFSVWIGQEKGTFLMCVVFLCVTVTQQADASPVSFALNRILDTTIGIITALVVNMIPWGTES